MSLIFGRTARVTAYRSRAGAPGGFIASNPTFFQQLPNGIEILTSLTHPGLRIRAQVEKTSEKEPNKCKIIINNCSDQTRTFLEQRPLIVRLDAGYDGQLSYVFTGDVRTAWSEFKSSTIETHLELADGDRAFRYAQVSRAYRKGTTVITAVKDCAASMGLQIDARTLASPELQAQFAAGRTLNRATSQELTDLLSPFGFSWSIQNGKLQILKDTQTRPDEALLISEDTDPVMVDSPTFATPDKPGKPTQVKVKTKLCSQLVPGSRFTIRSRSIHDATFRVDNIKHDLDTKTGPWDSMIEGKKAA